MQKKPLAKRTTKKEEIIGSETILEKIKDKTPWVFGKSLRKPKIQFPKSKRRRISLPMPSKAIGLIVILIILFILQTGIVYLLIKEPPALGSNSAGEPVFIYNNVHESFIMEGIVASILIILCSLGFIFIYEASKYVYNKKMAVWILGFGLIMIIITFILLQYMLSLKT